jgi:hypothetical protein
MKVSITGHEKGDLLAFNTCDCHIRPHFHYPKCDLLIQFDCTFL